MAHFSWDKASFHQDNQSDQSDVPPGNVLAGPAIVATDTNVLTVGAGEEFATLAAAVSAAQNGDVILVDAGTYVNDFADVTTDITIEGVGGMANFVATEAPTNLKGILTVDNNVTIENCSFSGAAIPEADGGNGAGIRYEGGVMVLENDAFSNNQNGILGAPVIPSLTLNTISIDGCLFQNNGAGDGFTHNCYIGAVSQLTFTNNISEGAIVGHELKSRAYVNIIENNTFEDGPTGTASYEIDLPDGGVDTVENNVIEKGPDASNEAMVHFGGEGIPYAGSSLLVEGNQFINDYGAGAVGVLNQTPYSATITGNSFANFSQGTLAQGPAVETDNTDGNGNPLPNGTLTGVLPGNTVIYTDDLPHTISLVGTLMAVEGGGGLLTVTAIGGHVIAIGGSGGMDYTEVGTSGGNTITTAAGSTNTLTLIGEDLVGSSGTDTIDCGACNVTGQVSGTAQIDDGTGNNSWDVMGTASIIGQGGNPVVSVGSTGTASITGTVDFLYVQNNGGNFSIGVTENGTAFQMTDTGGGVDTTVAGTQTTIATAAGPEGATLNLIAGTYNVTSVGNDTIYAGAGNDTIILEGAATVYAGTGTLAIYGRSDPGGASVYGNGGTYLFAGDTGNITYYGGALASTVEAQLGNITLLGGAGLLTIEGGSDDVMTGGAGGIDYTASDGGGANLITTEAGATDTLTLAGADVVNSYGNDTIYEGAGNQQISVFGTSTIIGGTGNNTVVMGGTDILDGVGQDGITVLQGANATIKSGFNAWITETGAAMVHFSVAAPHDFADVSVSGGQAQIQGGTSNAGSIAIYTTAGTSTRIHLGHGTDIVVSKGNDVIRAGSGTDAITITGAPDKIFGGSGTLDITNQDYSATDTQTVIAGAGAITFVQAAGALKFVGGNGAAVIDGGAGSLYVKGGSGSLTVYGGRSGFFFEAGSGAATVTLPSEGGTVEFVAGHGGGIDTINDFQLGTDTLVFKGVHVVEETVGGGSTTLVLSDNTQVLLNGFTDAGHHF